MKIIRIQGAENKNIPYLFNRVMPIARDFGCGGVYDVGKGNVTLNVWDRIQCIQTRFERVKNQVYGV